MTLGLILVVFGGPHSSHCSATCCRSKLVVLADPSNACHRYTPHEVSMNMLCWRPAILVSWCPVYSAFLYHLVSCYSAYLAILLILLILSSRCPAMQPILLSYRLVLSQSTQQLRVDANFKTFSATFLDRCKSKQRFSLNSLTRESSSRQCMPSLHSATSKRGHAMLASCYLAILVSCLSYFPIPKMYQKKKQRKIFFRPPPPG